MGQSRLTSGLLERPTLLHKVAEDDTNAITVCVRTSVVRISLRFNFDTDNRYGQAAWRANENTDTSCDLTIGSRVLSLAPPVFDARSQDLFCE